MSCKCNSTSWIVQYPISFIVTAFSPSGWSSQVRRITIGCDLSATHRRTSSSSVSPASHPHPLRTSERRSVLVSDSPQLNFLPCIITHRETYRWWIWTLSLATSPSVMAEDLPKPIGRLCEVILILLTSGMGNFYGAAGAHGSVYPHPFPRMQPEPTLEPAIAFRGP